MVTVQEGDPVFTVEGAVGPPQAERDSPIAAIAEYTARRHTWTDARREKSLKGTFAIDACKRASHLNSTEAPQSIAEVRS
jgi:hypothetical protein